MAFDDDEGPDDAPGRTPPAPDDRLWRHPSELARSTAPTPMAVPSAAPRHRALAVALAGAALGGAAIACGVLWLTRPGWVRETTTGAPRAASAPSVEYVAAEVPTRELAEALAPDLVRVEAKTGSGWTTATGLWLDSTRVLVVAPVVEGAAAFAVTDASQRRSTAQLSGVDKTTEAAVLTVEGTGSTRTTPLGSPAAPGQAVAVIGARGGSTSAEGQRVVPTSVSTTGVRAAVGTVVLHDALQLDRSLPDDALGAVVVDADGHLIGLVVDVDDDDHLALVVPAVEVIEAGRQLAETGEVRRAWLGVQAVDLDPGSSQSEGLDGGAVVTSVQPGSPAATAGIAAGDTIREIDGTEVHDASDLVLAIRRGHPGDRVEVRWWRDGEETAAQVDLGG